jgi:hypothetical protein
MADITQGKQGPALYVQYYSSQYYEGEGRLRSPVLTCVQLRLGRMANIVYIQNKESCTI